MSRLTALADILCKFTYRILFGHANESFPAPLAAYFSGCLETAPSAIRAQPFADVRHFLRDDHRIRSHEPKAAGMKLPERRLRQNELLWRTWRWLLDDRFVHNE